MQYTTQCNTFCVLLSIPDRVSSVKGQVPSIPTGVGINGVVKYGKY